MSTVLLDTNGYTSYLGGDHAVLDMLAEADVIYLSIFVLGELYTGFKGGNREQENLAILRRFVDKPGVSVVNAGRETADFFALIKTSLKKAGTPIPINDVWIGAHALETGSIIITYDKHFSLIPGLRLWNYSA
jgi:tRNA(fMet)-specific endonuclease VapC